MRIVGIAGSLRAGSFNAALLRAAAEECPPQATVEIESIRGIPLPPPTSHASSRAAQWD
jgi:chromate reductase, NAD(P)H dehydrogenase (quinone)